MTTTHEAPTREAATREVHPRNGNYVDVGGVQTYYEVTGTGEPVILPN